MPIHQLRALPGLALLLSSFACALPGPALTEERHALASPTEVSPLLGFSLEQALPRSAGVAQLTWGEGRDGVEFVPTASTTELHWALTVPEPESERFSIDEIDVECDLSRISTNTNMCDDRLEATFDVHLETSDGALSEDVPVLLSAHSLSDVNWSEPRLDISGLAGNFSIVAHQGITNTLRLGVFGTFDAAGASGALVGDVIMERKVYANASSESGTVVNVAQWREGGVQAPDQAAPQD